MNEAEIYQGLTDIFRDVLVNDDITLHPETTADDVEGWDSFSNVTLLVAAEQHFGVRISSREIEKLKNVGALVELIQKKQAGDVA